MKPLAIGFSIGTVLGLPTGVLMGWYKKCGYWIFPVLKIPQRDPGNRLIPIAMIALPPASLRKSSRITICVWFPVAYMTATGIAGVPNTYFETARTLGAGVVAFDLPGRGAGRESTTGIYTATGISFATLVVSEMIGAKAGLGWYINWAKGWSNCAKVYASIVIMAVLFSIIMALIFRLRDRLLIWQKGLLK